MAGPPIKWTIEKIKLGFDEFLKTIPQNL